jgi:hypothetical protein
MKIKLPNFFVPYGPVGHPAAQAFVSHLNEDLEELRGEFHSYLARASIQGNVPTLFFDEELSLEENGYHLLRVVNEEIPDDVLAALPRLAIYTPAAPGTPGRKLESMRKLLPSFYQHLNVEVWEPGKVDCDHDFGLESYAPKFKEAASGKVLSYEESWATDVDGTYYATVFCSRCGAEHALKESDT